MKKQILTILMAGLAIAPAIADVTVKRHNISSVPDFNTAITYEHAEALDRLAHWWAITQTPPAVIFSTGDTTSGSQTIATCLALAVSLGLLIGDTDNCLSRYIRSRPDAELIADYSIALIFITAGGHLYTKFCSWQAIPATAIPSVNPAIAPVSATQQFSLFKPSTWSLKLSTLSMGIA